MLTYNGASYTWMGRELRKITSGSNTYSYKYNADGIRTSKTVNGTATEFFLNGTQILAQKTGDSVMRFFYDSTGKRVGFANGTMLFYYLYNVQGDVIAIVRAATGQIVAKYSYDAWGNCTVTNATGYAVGDKNPFRYRGYYYDTETGLYYLNSRYYNPEFGRFISADSVISGTGESVQGYNLFAYCNNNPINMSDETGHWPKWSTILKAAAIVVMAAAVVAAAAVTVSTFGAGSVAGVAVITAALSIAAKATEVTVLQTKKSTTKSKSPGGGSSSGNNANAGSKNKGGGQVTTDVIDAVFDNGIKILMPSATKALTTGAAFAKDDLFNNPVLNSDFNKFITGSAKTFGMVTAYGFAVYAWVQTTISIFCDDPAQRAMDRGYRLK